MTTRIPTTIRLSEDERREIETTMKRYGYSQLAPFIRFAVGHLSLSKEAEQRIAA